MKALKILPKINLTKTAPFWLMASLSLPALATDFSHAKQQFEQQNYQQAYELFGQLVESDYASLDYSFYLAQSAQALGKVQEAITAYERVLINHPSDTRSKLELGRLYFEMAEYSLSKEYFEAALSDDVPSTVKTNINTYLQEINAKTSLASLTGAAVFGIGYDSNINTAPSASSWNLPAFNLEFNNATDTETGMFHQEMVNLNHYYNSSKKLSFDINNNLLAYTKFYPGNSDFNIIYLRYKPSLVFVEPSYTIETGASLDTMNYGGERYLNGYGAYASWAKSLEQERAIKSELSLQNKSYLRDEDNNRDAIQIKLANNYYQLISPNLTWMAALDLVNNRKIKGDRTDVDYQNIRIENSLSYQVDSDLKLSASLGISQTQYQDKSAFFLNKRQDDTFDFGLEASKTIDKDYSLQGRVEHSINRSNQAAYEFNKNVFLVNLIRRF